MGRDVEDIEVIVDKLMEHIVRPTTVKKPKEPVTVDTTPIGEGDGTVQHP